MVNIELTSQQAEELKNFYISELEKIQKRSDVIKELLSKLDTEHAFIKLPETMQAKETTPKEITSQEETPKKITSQEVTETKNPKWNNFIIQILQEKLKPLSSKALIRLYKKEYKANIVNIKSLSYSLAQALYTLRVKTKQIQSIKIAGKKEKLYALAEWADKSSMTMEPEKTINTENNNPESAIELNQNTPPKFKYNWPQFIKETLIKQKRILTLNELLRYAMFHFELSTDKKKSIRGNLSPTISSLGKSKILKPVQKEGIRGMSYGLAEWFDDDGNLIVDYK